MHGLFVALALHRAAAPAGVDATWRSDGTCPEAQFRRSLDDHLAGAVAREPLRAAVRVRRAAPGRWTLTLTLARPGDRVRTRRLEGSSCASVSEAAAFVTAVAVDPTVLDRAPPDPDAPTTPPDAPPAGPKGQPDTPAIVPPLPTISVTSPKGQPTAPASGAASPAHANAPVAPSSPPPDTEPAHVTRPRGHLRLAGGFETLGAPRLGAQLHLATGLSGRTWRIELRGIYRASTRADPWPDLPASARIGLWTLGALGCGLLRPGPLEVPLCAGVEAGQLSGVGRGFSGARPDRLPWVAAVFAPALAWGPRPRLAVWLGLEAAVPLTRNAFHIDGLGLAHETAPVSLRGALGIELRFP